MIYVIWNLNLNTLIYFDKTVALIPQGNIDLRFDTILMQSMIYLKLTTKKLKEI